MTAETHPTMTETAAVFSAVNAYRSTMGLDPGDAADLPVYLEELKQSIAKVELVLQRGGAS